MERNIYLDDELEDFLKEKSDQYKLYPSDKVWNNINRSLHPKFRWAYSVLTFLFLFTSIAISDHKYFTTVTKGDRIAPGRQLALTEPQRSSISKSLAQTQLLVGNQVPSVPLPAAVLSGTAENLATHGTIPVSIPSFLQKNATADLWLTDLAEQVNAGEPKTPVVSEMVTTETPRTVAIPPVVNDQESSIVENITNQPRTNDETIGDNVRKVLWAGEPFKRPRFSWQASFSPTLSYRRLTSGLHEITSVFRGIPYDSDREVTSVNDAVTHKPAIGAEAGVSLNYRVSNSFILKAGLQVSYSRYQVKATPIKFQRAVLAVNTDSRNHTDSITVMSSLMNFNGDGSAWYNNQYYQLSMPVGFEWQVLGTSTFKWNVAASAQPVFNFSNNVYLLSTDFRNYGKDPSLVRKWNLSAGIETFLSYNISNSFKLQAGPQLRYQLFSSYKKQYPIREYMVDLGFKVGITKTIR